MHVKGVVPALGTPLSADETVDVEGLRRLVRYVVSAGVDALLVNGSMGGFAFLTDEEQNRAVAITVAEVAGRVPVIGGVGETGTRRAVRRAQAIEREGVNAISILPPFYFLAQQPQLFDWFAEIAASVHLPVFLYDNPVLTKNPLQPETVARLVAEVPNVVGIKVSNQDMINLQKLLHLLKAQRPISVLTGSEHLIVACLQMGCHGFVGGVHNLCPNIGAAIFKAWCAGNVAEADRLQRDLISVWEIFLRGGIWGGYDEALRYLGICETATGAPYRTSVTSQERAEIHAILDRYVKSSRSCAAI